MKRSGVLLEMITRGEVKSLADRAGGRWAISWQAYALSAPVSTLAIIGAAGKFAKKSNQLFLISAVAVSATALVGLFLFGLHKTLFRNRSTVPVSPLAIAATGIIASGIFTAGIEFGKMAAGIPMLENIWGQVIANSVLITWWGLTISLVLDDREIFSKQRDAVIFSAIELEHVTLRGSETEDRLRKALNKKISNEISEARSVLNAAVASAKNAPMDKKWSPIADLMRSIASDVMRPLSKKLWDSAEVLFPRPGFIKILITIINSQPLRPLPMTLIAVLLSAETLVGTFGWPVGAWVMLLTVAFVWIVMPLANLAIRKAPKFHAGFFWLTVVSFQIFDTWVWSWAGQLANVEVQFGTLALNVVASFILIVLTSGFGAYGDANQQSLEGFRNELNKRELSTLVKNRVVSALALEASRNLHGRVQTRLLSCAGAIDRAAATGDIELLNRALVEVNEIFDAAALFNEAEAPLGLQQKLTRAAAPWTGLCETRFEFPPDLPELSPKQISDITDVVEEAITNAVRHGGASVVIATVRAAGDGIEIVVSDNGSGMSGNSQGVGTELIRMVSGGNYGFASNPLGGVDLSVLIPTAGY